MPRGRPVVNRLELNAEQTATLKAIANSRSEELRRVQRAKAFLGAATGRSQKEIAAEIGLSVSAVARMLRKALQIGPMMALDDLKRSGRPITIGEEARTWVKSIACTPPKDLDDGPTQALWTIDTLAAYVRKHAGEKPFGDELAKASKSTIWTILEEGEIKPHRIRYYLEKKDPEFEAKCKEVLLLYKRVEMELQFRDTLSSSTQPNGAVFVSYDEKPGIQAIGNIHPDRPPQEGKGFTRRDYEYKRHGTLSLLAGIDLITGKVHSLIRERHKSSDFVDFLKLIDAHYPKECVIFMVLDNHSIHTSRETRAFLDTRKGRFQFIFTPKHASWLNLIEAFFSKMARMSLRGLRVSSKDELKEHIQSWLDECNADPVPFRWRWKMDEVHELIIALFSQRYTSWTISSVCHEKARNGFSRGAGFSFKGSWRAA